MWKQCAKYLVGSSLFLENCKDIDYLFVYERRSDLEKANKMAIHNLELDMQSKLKSDLETKLYTYSYSHHFWKKLEGEDIEPYSIYEHDKEYAQLLLDYANTIRNTKHWYHFVLGSYALKNGKGKKFTKTQIARAQKAHDRKISREDLQDLFDYLLSIVNN